MALPSPSTSLSIPRPNAFSALISSHSISFTISPCPSRSFIQARSIGFRPTRTWRSDRSGCDGFVRCSAGLETIGRGMAREGADEGLGIPERAKVVALVAFVMSLCNADRVVMSVAVVPLAARYGWSCSFIGIVQSSFLWGYLASSLAGGILADRYGGKRVMACGAAIWSVATLLTPYAADHSTAMLLATRTLFGLAEGVALPSMNTLLSRWFPWNERATAVGISMAGFHLGNVMGFLATPALVAKVGINGAFGFFGSMGFLWLSIWVLGVTNDPRESGVISIEELRLIEKGKRKEGG